MGANPIRLDKVGAPQLPRLGPRPSLAAAEYDVRMRQLLERSEAEAVVVYGDREHSANIVHCCGFDPRFEEALLVVTADRRSLLVGNEGLAYADLLPVALDVIHTPSLSLMGQSRASGSTLAAALREAGVVRGKRTAIAGWKYFDRDELEIGTVTFAVPAFVVDALTAASGAEVADATPVLMAPVDGMRATNTADQIALFEWGATRASLSVARIVQAAAPGVSEEDAVASAGYTGDPLTAHVMFASGSEVAVGLRSPSQRLLLQGDCATTAVGYWGGLCCRAAMIATADDALKGTPREFIEQMAIPYWSTIVRWYELVGIGVTGQAIDSEVRALMDRAGLAPALNPGHLTGVDEWIHSPIRPDSADQLRSGMALQCDIIATNARPGWAANCEDTIALADESLRNELRQRHPETWGRIEARRQYMHDTLGIEIGKDVLPLSAFNAYFPPLWLSWDTVLTAA
jgi:Xaa-Pro aminopeptidase